MIRIAALAISAALLSAPALAGAPRASDLPAIGNGPAGPSVQAQCGAQWKADKADLSAKGYTWPKYYSACARAMKAEKAASVRPAVAACTTDADCAAKNPGL